ncbi:MAG: hypothetical protein ABIG86_01785 [Patescibacteria group bacterium]
MGIADEKRQKLRFTRQAERTFRDFDYSVKLFSVGWVLFFAFSIIGAFSFAFAYFFIMKWIFPPSDGYGLAIFAVQSGMLALFGGLPTGQLVALITLSKLGKKWQGNLRFGSHPVLFISLASLITFNICFFLLLTLILSFKPT